MISARPRPFRPRVKEAAASRPEGNAESVNDGDVGRHQTIGSKCRRDSEFATGLRAKSVSSVIRLRAQTLSVRIGSLSFPIRAAARRYTRRDP
jgi:hypothetical protein